MEKLWYEYIIECIGIWKYNFGEIRYYTGETQDIEKRWLNHVHKVDSAWMKNNGWRPRRLVYVECLLDCYSRDIAQLREKQLKRLPRDIKRGFAT
jgi:predicted GIY-YIG superfamily endonuclease